MTGISTDAASAHVNDYLIALDEFGPTLGRDLTHEELSSRRDGWLLLRVKAGSWAQTADSVRVDSVDRFAARLLAEGTGAADELERHFVDAARPFAEAFGVGYRAWRIVGVPTHMLARAGIRPGQSRATRR